MQSGPADRDDLLADQRAFYRARAPEYDQWWQRRGRYDRGPDDAAEWDRQVQLVVQALDAFGPVGYVLELAGGTGWWTQHLAQTAARLTVLDSSDETLRINSARVGRPPGKSVTYIVADIFGWRPDRRYDTVFFSFWLSHVPRQLFETFWALVGSCLRPGGRAFLIDNRRDPTRAVQDPYIVDEADDVQRRRLSDGSEHRVIKVFYEPDELAERLRQLGWAADLAGTSRFIYGSAVPVDSEKPRTPTRKPTSDGS
jgi:SAM-dependent methyltransferase